ncbi:MAG: DUF1905 domain-containing protein [Maribacter sp.]
MSGTISYNFTAKVWKHGAAGGWHFVSLPTEVSKEIRALFGKHEEGWGRLKVVALVGDTQWKTAIWFDTKGNTYLLPLKATVRKQERMVIGEVREITILI